MYRAPSFRPWFGPAVLATLLVLPAGCGDEDSDPTNVTPTNQQNLEQGMAGLTAFGEDALANSGAQMAQNPEIVALLEQIGFSGIGLAIPLARYAPGLFAKATVWRKASRMRPAPRVDLVTGFGTYERDVTDVSEPFPGWVLREADNPPDGLIFEFDLQDDISTYDEMGNEVPLQGAIRFLEIVVDAGQPETTEDDILTHFVFEIAALPVEGVPLTVLRANLSITLNELREPSSITVGNPAANSTAHPDAAFVGPLLVALGIEISPSEVPNKANSNLVGFAQLFDTVDNYALRFQLALTNIDFASSLPPESASIAFGFGNTTNPSLPPWEFTILASEFVEDTQNPGTYVADIGGGIAFNQGVVATFSGNTTEVPVDIDGDQNPDGTCPNVDVTFTDDPGNAVNVCVALPVILNLVTPAF